MENGLTRIDPAVLVLMHGSFAGDGALRPFAREIMLIECHVAGTSHVDVASVEPQLSPGALLPLKREPLNPHDPLAILILSETGQRIGYVPRAKNEALAHLMDAGKLLFGKVEAKTWQGGWLKVDTRIYLRDM